MIKGFLYHELEVDVSAEDLWEIYGTIRLAKVVMEMIPHVILKVEVEEGDGGAGTIIRTSYPPSNVSLSKFGVPIKSTTAFCTEERAFNSSKAIRYGKNSVRYIALITEHLQGLNIHP